MDTPTKQLPPTLYIADAKERLMNFLVDDLFERIINEVETEQNEKEQGNNTL